ncbi:MAG: NADH-quinone oxidoreductase subunit NuoN [Rhodanobacteraceae bacterium]
MPNLTDVLTILPELYLLAATCVLLLMDVFLREDQKGLTHYLAIAIALVAIWLVIVNGQTDIATAFNGMYLNDGMATVLKVFILLSTVLVFVYARPYLQQRKLHVGEFYSLTLFASAGAMFLVSAGNLVTLYLGLQLLALCSYTLVALNRESPLSSEAAMKYFVLSALASGLLLYGMSMIYGATGTLDLAQIAAVIPHAQHQNLLLFGLVFVVVGITFELGVAPFHMWLPDVYEGSPTPVTNFIGSVSKLAAFGMAVRLLDYGLHPLLHNWQAMLAALAVLSLVIGNFVAIVQSNLKRMLAYSTISHMGFVLLGLVQGNGQGYGAALFYVVCYALMSSAAFGVILAMARAGFEAENIDDFRGLNKRSPWFAGIMAMAIFSLAGIPPLWGFYAKLLVLKAAIDAGFLWLAIVAIITAIIGLFYYLRVVKVMYFDAPEEGSVLAPVDDKPLRWVLSLNGLALLVVGLYWGPLLTWCQQAFAG